MARVRYLDPEDLTLDDRSLLQRPISLNRALAHSPGGARAFDGVGKWIRYKSKLDPRLRELAILQVGWLARSAYEWSHHVKIGRDFGVSDGDVRALIAESQGRDSGLDDLDRLVLSAARQMVVDGAIADATFTGLRQHLNEELVVELVLTIGFYCGVVRVLGSLQIDVEPDYQCYLDAFPLPVDEGESQVMW